MFCDHYWYKNKERNVEGIGEYDEDIPLIVSFGGVQFIYTCVKCGSIKTIELLGKEKS